MVCEHQVNNYTCKICNLEKNCKHGIKVYLCGCIKNAFCIHKKRKYSCKICNFEKNCKHRIKAYLCGCIKNTFCTHKKDKYKCSICKSGDIKLENIDVIESINKISNDIRVDESINTRFDIKVNEPINTKFNNFPKDFDIKVNESINTKFNNFPTNFDEFGKTNIDIFGNFDKYF